MSIYKNNPDFMARRTDPVTSHVAARRMVQSGAMGEQQHKALELVKLYPNHTSDELARYGVLDRYQLARRLPELEEAGLVEKGGIRKSNVSRRPSVTWHIRENR